jgi:NTP pyrophosphatase (non-canonical NTP hydrolase)
MMRRGGTAVDELQRLILELRRFAKARDWDRYHDPKNLAMAVASEAGELCDVLRWVDNAEADRFARDPKHQARIAEEAADVALLLLMLCARAGIDLLQAMRTKRQPMRTMTATSLKSTCRKTLRTKKATRTQTAPMSPKSRGGALPLTPPR